MRDDRMFERCRQYIHCRLTEGGKRRVRAPKVVSAVTISRQRGARAVTIGKALARYLDRVAPSPVCHWTVFDENLVERVLADHQLPRRLKAYMPEDRVGEVTTMIEEILGLHPSSWTLFHHTVDSVVKLASLGQVILVGRGTNLMTSSLPGVLHIRLIGSLRRRVGHVSRFYGLSEPDAQRLVKRRDAASRRFVRQNFAISNVDPLLYDLVINTDQLRDQAVAEVIGNAFIEKRKTVRLS